MSQAGSLGGGGGGTSREPITRYVVDGGGTGEYTTIQDAMDAAVADGLSDVLIFIKPGVYTENLNIPGINITFMGCDLTEGLFATFGETTINGTHTIAATGTRQRNFYNLTIKSTNGNTFPFTANSTYFTFENCHIQWDNGWFIDVVDFHGEVVFKRCRISASTRELINYSGTGKITSLRFYECYSITCSITVFGDGGGDIEAQNTYFFNTDIELDEASGSFRFCHWKTGSTITLLDMVSVDVFKCSIGEAGNAAIAFTVGSNSNLDLYDTTINSSAANVITETVGGNTVNIDNVNFVNSSGVAVAGTFYQGVIKGNKVDMDLDVRGREMIADGDSGAGTAGTVQYTATIDEALSTGNGTVLMKTANPGNSSGWLKIFANGNVRYIPYWTNISP